MKKSIKVVIGLVTIFLSTNSLANLPIKSGMDYSKARKLLLNNGWKPIVMNKTPNGKPSCYLFIGSPSDCNRQYEIAHCMPTGAAYCSMFFVNKRKEYLKVITSGEDPIVDYWEILKKKPKINIIR